MAEQGVWFGPLQQNNNIFEHVIYVFSKLQNNAIIMHFLKLLFGIN